MLLSITLFVFIGLTHGLNVKGFYELDPDKSYLKATLTPPPK